MRARNLPWSSVIALSLGLIACEGSNTAPRSAGSTAPATAESQAPEAKQAPAVAPKNTTVNDFLKRGTPTFVRGTAGDDLADRAVVAQVDFIRQLFPGAKVVDDESIDVKGGPEGWPDNPVAFGGPHVNHLLAKLALPFELSAGKLSIGEETLEGDGYFLMTVVPARTADDDGPGHPEFLLYAGTGTPGIEEINSVSHGADSILIADEFGRFMIGKWRVGKSRRFEAAMSGKRARRIAWRAEERPLATARGGELGSVRIMFPKQLPAADDESEIIDACLRGLETVARKLDISEPVATTVYVHPDRRSKEQLTGNAGDGHAMVVANTLHVIRFDPAGLEKLMAHEGTHILAYRAWGPASAPLWGEGLAVWVSGQYARKSLAEHKRSIDSAPRIEELLKLPAFKKLPEQQSYPLAGLFVQAMVKEVGVPNVRDHLIGATADSWPSACEAAGTTPAALQDAFAKAVQ